MTIRLSTGTRNGVMGGDDLAAIFANSIIEIRTGSQPASADDAATGTLLGTITLDGGAFVAGSPTNGLNFELSPTDAGMIRKPAAANWRMTGVAAGTAGWYRLKANAVDNGASSTTAARIDGSVGTPGAGTDLAFSTLSVAVGAPMTIDRFEYVMPAS